MWCALAIQMSYPEKHVRTPPHFLKRAICFLATKLCSSCTLDISSLLDGQIAVIFSHSAACLITLIVSFALQKFWVWNLKALHFFHEHFYFLAQRDIADFYMLFMYPATLLGLSLLAGFWWSRQGFLCVLMWPTNRHLLVFLSGYHTFSLPHLVAPAMTSTRMLESTGIDISAPDLWLILVHVNCGFVICGIYCVDVYFPHLLRFYWEKKLNFVKRIFLSDTTAWLLSSKLSLWCILFIDLHMLNSPCITG